MFFQTSHTILQLHRTKIDTPTSVTLTAGFQKSTNLYSCKSRKAIWKLITTTIWKFYVYIRYTYPLTDRTSQCWASAIISGITFSSWSKLRPQFDDPILPWNEIRQVSFDLNVICSTINVKLWQFCLLVVEFKATSSQSSWKIWIPFLAFPSCANTKNHLARFV